MATKSDPDRDDRIAVTIGVVIVDVFLAGIGLILGFAIDLQVWNNAGSTSVAQKQYTETMSLGGGIMLVLLIGGIAAFWLGARWTALVQCVLIVGALVFTASAMHVYYHAAHPVTSTNYQPTTVSTVVCVNQGFCPPGSVG